MSEPSEPRINLVIDVMTMADYNSVWVFLGSIPGLRCGLPILARRRNATLHVILILAVSPDRVTGSSVALWAAMMADVVLGREKGCRPFPAPLSNPPCMQNAFHPKMRWDSP
jgi:hypothetical protein